MENPKFYFNYIVENSVGIYGSPEKMILDYGNKFKIFYHNLQFLKIGINSMLPSSIQHGTKKTIDLDADIGNSYSDFSLHIPSENIYFRYTGINKVIYESSSRHGSSTPIAYLTKENIYMIKEIPVEAAYKKIYSWINKMINKYSPNVFILSRENFYKETHSFKNPILANIKTVDELMKFKNELKDLKISDLENEVFKLYENTDKNEKEKREWYSSKRREEISYS